jgi:hypothetical protein
MNTCLFSITAKEIEEEQTVFTFAAGTLKLTIHAGPCMHCYEEIQPLLEGKDYEYGDCHFEIIQRNGTTTFSLHSEGTAFDMSVPTFDCIAALKFWVEQTRTFEEEAAAPEDENSSE